MLSLAPYTHPGSFMFNRRPYMSELSSSTAAGDVLQQTNKEEFSREVPLHGDSLCVGGGSGKPILTRPRIAGMISLGELRDIFRG